MAKENDANRLVNALHKKGLRVLQYQGVYWEVADKDNKKFNINVNRILSAEKIGFKESAIEEIDRPSRGAQYVPLLGGAVASAENLMYMGVFQRLSKDYDYSKPVFPETFTAGAAGVRPARYTTREKDVKIAENLMLRLSEQQRRGYSYRGMFAKGVPLLLTWAAEFAMTGGLSKLGNVAAKKAGEKILKGYVKKKGAGLALGGAGWIGGAAARTVGLAPRVAEAVTRRQMPTEMHFGESGELVIDTDPENFATSIAKGWATIFIEAASEEAGPTITKTLKLGLTKLPFGGKLMRAVQKEWMKLSPLNTSAKFVNKALTRAGYHGMIGEIGEERLATLMHAIVKTEDFGAGKDANVFERLAAGFTQDVKNFPVEFAILSLPAMGRFTIIQTADMLSRRQWTKMGVSATAGRKAERMVVEGKWSMEEADTMMTISKVMGDDVALEYSPDIAKDRIMTEKGIEAREDALAFDKEGRRLREDVGVEPTVTAPKVAPVAEGKAVTGKPITLNLHRGIRAKDKGKDFATDAGDLGAGAYWSTSKSVANAYGAGGKVLSETKSFKNPLVLSAEEAVKLSDQYKTVNAPMEERLAGARKMSKDLRRQGYDALIVEGYDVPKGEYTIVELVPTVALERKPLRDKQTGRFVSILGKKLTKEERVLLSETVAEKVKMMKEDAGMDDEYFENRAQAMYPDRSKADIRKIATKLREKTEAIYSKYALRRQALFMQAVKEILDSKGFVKPGERGGARTFVHEKHDKIESLVWQMVDLKEDSFSKMFIYDAINSGVDKQDRLMLSMEDRIANFLGNLFTAKELEGMSSVLAPNYYRNKLGKMVFRYPGVTTTKVKLSTGEVSLNRDQILDIAMHALNPHSMKAMMTKRGWYLGKTKHAPMTKADVKKVVGLLTDRERQLLMMAVRMGSILGDKGNEVSMEMDGEKKFEVFPYWHLIRTEVTPRPIGKKVSHLHQVMENWSPFLERKKGAVNPVVITGFFPKLYNSVSDMSAYYGLAQPVRDAKLLISDRGWSRAVRDKYGQKALDVILDYIGRVEDPSYYRIPIGSYWSRRLNKVVRSLLGFNPGVALKQSVSYMLSMDEINPKIVFRNYLHMAGNREMYIINQFIPQLAMRYRHGRIIREVGDLGRTGAARRAFLHKSSFDDLAMTTIKGMDFQAIGRIVKCIEDELAMTNPNLEVGSEQWGEALNQRVMEVVRRTQPTWEPKDRSHIGGTRSQILRWFTVFHSQRETTVGMMNRANQRYRIDGDTRRLIKTYALVATTNVMYSAISAFMGRYLYRSKRDYRDFLIDIGTNFARLFYFGEVVSIAMQAASRGLIGKPPAKEEPFEAIIGEPFSHLNRGLYNVTAALTHSITGEKYKAGKNKGKLKWKVEAFRAGEELGLAVSMYLGAPTYAPYRIVRGVTKTVQEARGKGEKKARKDFVDIYK